MRGGLAGSIKVANLRDQCFVCTVHLQTEFLVIRFAVCIIR